ncbi:hypothetical protein [Tengunoibacter tsumagoiensis]|uniref:Uncharacterized protein n=1 Tax=Tengunoibacter tsumagoiensis TaxID=2014871 RepID=A0A401ZV89_9CHLR|nr:hypothetical protein [Tengunoibacter tsumagoiensis]GCE10757.1 hypothetical protein KTT_06160 [Tengunoibacter tsumagoiensis]
MFNKVSYRRGVIEGVIIYTLGRLGALISPVVFPDWTYVAAPLLFWSFMFIFPSFWATRRILSTRRERLSKRFWLLGPRLAAICFAIDLFLSLAIGQAVKLFGVQQGPVLLRLLQSGPDHMSLLQFGVAELLSASLFAFFTMGVICTRLAQGGFLRFTMPAGGNRVTL